MAHEITYNNFEISRVVFMPNITTNHAITYTKIITISHSLASVGAYNLILQNNIHVVVRKLLTAVKIGYLLTYIT